MANKIYSMMTERILDLLDQGVIPWRKPWRTAGGFPVSITGHEYRGINVLVLSMEQQARGFRSNLWLTLKQANRHGGHVRKGERSTPVVFWKWMAKADRRADTEAGEAAPRETRVPLLRYYRVFNLDQTEGVRLPERFQPADDPEPVPPAPPIEACEGIVAGMPSAPPIRHHGTAAYYTPAQDTVTMPDRDLFSGSEEYYSTLFHELTHATGHPSRLDRHAAEDADHRFGSVSYSREELVAELGSAMLCAVAGIAPTVIENQAAYIDGWRKRLSTDARLVVVAAAQAQKAADFILGRASEGDSEVAAEKQLPGRRQRSTSASWDRDFRQEADTKKRPG